MTPPEKNMTQTRKYMTPPKKNDSDMKKMTQSQ